jgi:Lrp/AsnC family transcriptional regulator, leucine-responsive regulatory protein
MHSDKFDLEILQLLGKNSRLSWRELGEKVNLSASSCQRRVQALQEKGIIRHFTTACDYVSLGFDVKAFVEVKINRHDNKVTQQFKDAVIQYPEVISCHKITGNIDFILEVIAKDLRSFGLFIEKKILYLPGVIDASSTMVLEDLKLHGQAVKYQG